MVLGRVKKEHHIFMKNWASELNTH